MEKNQKEVMYQQSNIHKYIMAGMLSTMASSLCSEGYIQAILLEFDNGAAAAGVYGVIAQIASVIAYIIFLFDSPSKRGFMQRFVLFAGLQAIFPMVLGGIFPGRNILTVFMMAGFVYNFALAYRSSCEQGAVPRFFSRNAYASALMWASLTGAMGALLLTLLGRNMAVIFGCSALGFLSCAVLTAMMRMRQPEEKEQSVGLIQIVKNCPLQMLYPHAVRGVGMAGIYYFAVYCMERVALNDTEKNALIFLPVAAMMVAYLVYKQLKMYSGRIANIAFICCALCMAASPFLHSSITFLTGYFLITVGNQLSVTVGVVKSTEDTILPFVTGARMILTNGVRAIATFVLALLYATSFQESVIIISVVALLISGELYRKTLNDKVGNGV